MSDREMADRVIGSMVGLAVGDAMGASVEGWSRERIRDQFGTLREYAGSSPGVYTDDTQQALCVLDTLLKQGGFTPDALAAKFIELGEPLRGAKRERVTSSDMFGVFRGPTSGFRQGVNRLSKGVDWREAGMVSAGNGSAVRVAPLALYYQGDRKRLLIDVINGSWITHRDPRGPAGALAIAFTVVYAAKHQGPFSPEEYFEQLLVYLRDGEEYLRREFFTPDLGVSEDACNHMSQAVDLARDLLERSTEDAVEEIGRFARECTHLPTSATSAFIIGSGTTSIYTFAKHHHDFEKAVVTAINLGGDTDTMGAMVGAMTGAFHGWSAIPEPWRQELRNHDEIYKRAKGLAENEDLLPDVRPLREMEAELTRETISE